MKDMKYVWAIPRVIPEGKILCHNHVRHEVNTMPGVNGFRAWLAPANEHWLAWGYDCPCGWSGLKHRRLYPFISDENLEVRARRLARSLELRIEKSRTRKHFNIDDRGGYRIVNDYRNQIVAGERYDMNLAEVMEWLLAQ